MWELKNHKRVEIVNTHKLLKELRMRAQELGYEGRKSQNNLGTLLANAADKIEELQREITDMGWQLNPDGMGK